MLHASVAVQVLLRERLHPVPTSPLSVPPVIVGVPVQLSLAVGVGLGKVDGLHPKSVPAEHGVNTGPSVSTVYVYVCVHVDELLHASVAVQVLLRERMHPVPASALNVPPVMVGVPPQLSLAVGVGLGKLDGLHPRFVPAGQDVNTGIVLSVTLLVKQQTTCPSSHLIVSQIVY